MRRTGTRNEPVRQPKRAGPAPAWCVDDGQTASRDDHDLRRPPQLNVSPGFSSWTVTP